MVKRLPAMQETRVRFLSWEDPLEEEMATHSSILVWRVPYNPWGHKELDTTERLLLSFSYIHTDISPVHQHRDTVSRASSSS